MDMLYLYIEEIRVGERDFEKYSNLVLDDSLDSLLLRREREGNLRR